LGSYPDRDPATGSWKSRKMTDIIGILDKVSNFFLGHVFTAIPACPPTELPGVDLIERVRALNNREPSALHNF